MELFNTEIKTIVNLIPLFQSLGNPDLKPRHWKQIFETLKPDFNPGKYFSINDLVSEGALEK